MKEISFEPRIYNSATTYDHGIKCAELPLLGPQRVGRAIHEGGGRGKPNIFDIVSVAWAIVLNEIFRIRHDASTPTYLSEWQPPRATLLKPGRWAGPVMLSDGKTITEYLRREFENVEIGPWPICVLLATGYIEREGLASDERFAQLNIGPPERVLNFVHNWLKTEAPHTYLLDKPANGPRHVVRCAAQFNFTQVCQQVIDKAKEL